MELNKRPQNYEILIKENYKEFVKYSLEKGVLPEEARKNAKNLVKYQLKIIKKNER